MSDKDNSRTNEEMVRALLKMNPNMRQGKSTSELAQLINRGASDKPEPAKTPAAPAVNLVTELEALRVELDQGKHAIEQRRRVAKDQRQALTAERKHMRAQVCTEIVAAIRRVDLNLTDRKNQVLVQKEKAFLDDIGFAMSALLK